MDEKLEHARRRWLAQRDDASEREYHVALERAGWPWETAHLQRVGGWRLERVLCGYTLGAHACLAATFSRDGRRLVTSDATRLRVWDVATRRRMPGGGPIAGETDVLSLSPDGASVLFVPGRQAGGSPAELWRLDPWERVASFAIEGALCHDATHLADGRIATLHGDGVVRVWSAAGVEREAVHGAPEDAWGRGHIVARPGGGFVTIVCGDLRVWSADAEHERRCSAPVAFRSASATGLAVSHDDRYVAASWRDDEDCVALFDLATSALLAVRPDRSGALAFSDDALVVARGTTRFDVLERAGLEERATFTQHVASEGLSTSADGQLACLGGVLFDARSWQPVAPVAHRGRLDQVGFTTSTRRVVSASGPTLHTWDQDTGSPGWSLPGSQSTWNMVLLESPAAGALVLAGGETRWIDLRTFETHEVPDGLNYESVLAFPSRSARGAHVSRESVVLLDLRSGQRLWEWEWADDETPSGRPTLGTRAAFSSDDRRLFLAGREGIGAFDGATGHLIFMVPWPEGLAPLRSRAAQVRAIAASPAGQLLAVVTTDARLVTFNGSTGALHGVSRMDGPARAARFGERDDVLFLEDDRGWRAVDIRTGRAVATPPPEPACPVDFRLSVEAEEHASALAVSEDGQRLLMGTNAGSLLLYTR